MSKKSEQRAARAAAAQARDADLVERAKRDPFLIAHLRNSRATDPEGFAQVAAKVRSVAARPSDPDYRRALVSMGGLAALEAEPTS